jgi:hypothetical protein
VSSRSRGTRKAQSVLPEPGRGRGEDVRPGRDVRPGALLHVRGGAVPGPEPPRHAGIEGLERGRLRHEPEDASGFRRMSDSCMADARSLPSRA